MNSRIALLSGSNRPQSQSLKVARFLQERLERLKLCDATDLIDLASIRLPLWPEKDQDEVWRKQQQLLQNATALVVVSPEWNGMACPALKNFFLYAGLAELGHKPALLVGVSAGSGGAYPIAELRASSYKNSRIMYLPEHLIVRNVDHVFNKDMPASDNDIRLRTRSDWVLRMLSSYDRALNSIRSEIDMFNGDHSTGM
ncbi:NADPH-dependent FMN reductase [Pseudomonas sp. Irchel 3H7]|uniref:NADPH-dependent FMN reductase n=1 Tax=Pseudomonas sp. Irchel 3H7 TaxID=2009042 RepID=UPI000BA4B7E9|nr:NAD(P)H-dependent oxidoreductase [Pseudomonas sp. Irchel 3H7]